MYTLGLYIKILFLSHYIWKHRCLFSAYSSHPRCISWIGFQCVFRCICVYFVKIRREEEAIVVKSGSTSGSTLVGRPATIVSTLWSTNRDGCLVDEFFRSKLRLPALLTRGYIQILNEFSMIFQCLRNEHLFILTNKLLDLWLCRALIRFFVVWKK